MKGTRPGTRLGMVIQFILVNVQEVIEFGVLGKNITLNTEEEKTFQWILVCTKSDYVPEKNTTLQTLLKISALGTFNPCYQHFSTELDPGL